MNLTVDELLALGRFFDTFMKEAMDRMTHEDMQHIHAILLKLLAYTRSERERRFGEL